MAISQLAMGPADYYFVARLLHPVRFLQMTCLFQLLLKYCTRFVFSGAGNLTMALNILSTMVWGFSEFWFLWVYNTLDGIMYSIAFYDLLMGIAVRFFGCHEILW